MRSCRTCRSSAVKRLADKIAIWMQAMGCEEISRQDCSADASYRLRNSGHVRGARAYADDSVEAGQGEVGVIFILPH